MNVFAFSKCVRLAAMAGAFGLLNGCAMSSSEGEYQRAEPLPPMQIPEGMQTRSLEPLYGIPDIPEREDELLLTRGEGGFEVPRPDPLPTEGATESGVKIQRLGEERWILVDAPTSQVWPRVQSFLTRYGIAVDSSDPAVGLIETSWVEFNDDTDLQHRYRIWIEQGLRPDTTEVHVVHRQAPAGMVASSELEWTRRSEDPAQEALVADELASSLATSARNNSASLLGQRVGGQAKSAIEFVDGEPVLQLRLPYDRAWATVTHSLGQEEFALWERDSAKGVAMFSYLTDDVRNQPFWRRWFSDTELPEEAPAELESVLSQLADKPAVRQLFADIAGTEYGSPMELPHTFLVVFQDGGDRTSVHVRSAQGTQLSPRDARQILTLIRRNLI